MRWKSSGLPREQPIGQTSFPAVNNSGSGCEIVGLMESMNQGGLTLIVVTHDPRIAERARRRIRLSDGLIISDQLGA